ncbi:MAG: sensor histidine kinase [Limisphaerales bacterium]
MQPAATLYARIVGWLLLNLAILGAGFPLFFAEEFRIDPRMQMAGDAGDHVIHLARSVVSELSQSDRSEWNEILDRHGQTNALDLLLFHSDGTVMAGPQMEIPGSVMDSVAAHSIAAADLDARNFLFGPREPLPPDDRIQRHKGVRPVSLIVNPPGSDEWWFGVQLPLYDRQPQTTYHAFVLAKSAGLPPAFFRGRNWWPLALTAIGISVLLWIPMARHITRPIREITAATEMIADGQFGIALQADRSDELGRLAEAINKMSTHLEGFISGQKRFLGDTAHELCSPLARMQMAVGILETKATSADQKGYVNDISEEVQHMSDLVNELLSFSKASLQPAEIKIQPVDVKAIIDLAVKRETSGKASIKLNVPDELSAMANKQLLARGIGNLLRNAVRYAAHAGPIGIKAERREDFTFIVVWDSGPGISNDHIGMIFDPFYRPDASRTSTTGGVGLGMAIVKTCIETCGGRVICKNRRSQGLKVIIRLNAEPGNTATGLSHGEFDLPDTD